VSARAKAHDKVLRDWVTALWSLIESLRDDDARHVAAACDRALVAFHAARGGDPYLLLHEAAGALYVSGHLLPMDVGLFRPAQELVALFRTHGISEVMFDESVEVETLEAWARGWGDSESLRATDREFDGIHAGQRSDGGGEPEPASQRTVVEDVPDSRLRSTFMQYQLIAAFTERSVISPHLGRVTLGAVVDRMLGMAGGIEPLTLLQRDEALLHRSLHVAVFAVMVGRVVGWPEDLLADLGGAALLHDIGQVLDAEQPARSGFAWLIGRGSGPFWLRCAIIARTWRQDHGGELVDLGPDTSLGAVIVRLAVDLERAVTAGEQPDAIAQRLLGAAGAGQYPVAMAEFAGTVARQVLAVA